MITSHDLMRELEIRNIKTLTRWHQMQLIPPPQIKAHQTGPGTVAYWPEWVLSHGRRIRKLIADGATKKEVLEKFGTDWGKTAKLYSRYNFAAVSEQMDRHKAAFGLAEAIRNALRLGMASAHNLLGDFELHYRLEELVDSARLFILQDMDPVLVVVEKALHVVPNVVAAKWVVQYSRSAKLVTFCPLRPFFENTDNAYFRPQKSKKELGKSPEKAFSQTTVKEDFSFEIASKRTSSKMKSKSLANVAKPRTRSPKKPEARR